MFNNKQMMSIKIKMAMKMKMMQNQSILIGANIGLLFVFMKRVLSSPLLLLLLLLLLLSFDSPFAYSVHSPLAWVYTRQWSWSPRVQCPHGNR